MSAVSAPASQTLTVTDRFQNPYTFTLKGKFLKTEYFKLKSDLMILGQIKIPIENDLFREAFGTETRTYLEWLAPRVKTIILRNRGKNVYADYSKNGFVLRAAKSMAFDPGLFKVTDTFRRGIILHEAFHFESIHHTRCARPSRITPGENSCDLSWKSSYGIEYLYITSQLLSLSLELKPEIVIETEMSLLDRILDANSRFLLVQYFQREFEILDFYAQTQIKQAFERFKQNRLSTDKTPDISELFSE